MNLSNDPSAPPDAAPPAGPVQLTPHDLLHLRLLSTQVTAAARGVALAQANLQLAQAEVDAVRRSERAFHEELSARYGFDPQRDQVNLADGTISRTARNIP